MAPTAKEVGGRCFQTGQTPLLGMILGYFGCLAKAKFTPLSAPG